MNEREPLGEECFVKDATRRFSASDTDVCLTVYFQFAGRGGWKAHAVQMGSPNASKQVYEYVHSVIDARSRRASSEILSDERGTTRSVLLEWTGGKFTRRSASHGSSG